MAQRNPMNDRYTTDDKKGQTRKSAATAKPKSKAASSVRVESTKKTPKQKKEQQQLDRKRQQEISRKYYNPPLPEYKKWRKVWWGLLIFAVVMTASSFLVRFIMPENDMASMIVLGGAYIGIIGALVIDGLKIRKIRKEYQQTMIAKETKAMRAAEKKQRAAKAQEEAEAAENKPSGILGSLTGMFKKPAAAKPDTEKAATDSADATKDAKADAGDAKQVGKAK